jgi:uncharacterized membrane protein
MTEELSSQLPAPSAGAPSSSLISTTLIVYALFGIGAISALASSGFPLVAPLMGVIGIIALIAAYVKRDEAAGTWLQSHYRWLIRTFWFSFLWGIVGGLILITLGLVLIGIPIAFAIWIATTLWVIYRLVRGYLLFSERKPIPGM